MSAPVLSWPFIANGRGLRPGVHGPRRRRHPEAAAAARVASPSFPPPGPQSQSFSRSYGSILPTSLIYIVLSTRGCTPWRPDAVISTPGGANRTRAGIFTGHPEGPRTRPRPRSSGCLPASPAKPIPQEQAVNQQRERWPGLRLASPHAARVAAISTPPAQEY